ncbi:hypothetical protein BaRGS_00015278 [Batillaria attramentaria]|uniref:Uncharacterized protein n=1 Tax=Batillaria attramentaria TaxID=370345 RepID=A0ABD0L236_9CAEN
MIYPPAQYELAPAGKPVDWLRRNPSIGRAGPRPPFELDSTEADTDAATGRMQRSRLRQSKTVKSVQWVSVSNQVL